MRHDRRYWTRVVAAAERGSATHAEVAARYGVSIGTLRSWVYRLRSEGERVAGPRLLPIRVTEAGRSAETSAAVTIVVVRGVEIRVATGTDVAYVAALVRALG
jgi:transposase